MSKSTKDAVLVPAEPICPDWCQVSRAEHESDDREDLPEGYQHFCQEMLPNAYASSHSEWAPLIDYCWSQPYDGSDPHHYWIQLECSTYLRVDEARALAAKLLEAVARVESATGPSSSQRGQS